MTDVCEACQAVPAPGNTFTSLCNFRGHDICPGCYRNWGHKDKDLGREATWKEFLSLPTTRTRSSSKRNEVNKARNECIVELAKEGKSRREISSLVGLCRATIQGILRECWR